jgi:hypothetical protein
MTRTELRSSALQRAELRRRIARARSQRGAAVLVVTLVVVLLTALGMFALRSSTISTATSGHNRMLTQVHFVADYAVIASMAYGSGGRAQDVETKMNAYESRVASGEAKIAGFDTMDGDGRKVTGMLLGYDDIETMAKAANPTNKLIAPSAPGAPGSLGVNPSAGPSWGMTPLDADMRVEMTDLTESEPTAGQEVAGGLDSTARWKWITVTVTASGLVRPMEAAAGTWDQKAATAAGVELSRARLRLGPIALAQD